MTEYRVIYHATSATANGDIATPDWQCDVDAQPPMSPDGGGWQLVSIDVQKFEVIPSLSQIHLIHRIVWRR